LASAIDTPIRSSFQDIHVLLPLGLFSKTISDFIL